MLDIAMPIKTEKTLPGSLHERDQADDLAILLADDEEVVRSVGSDILHILGYDVLVAGNGPETVAVFKQNHNRIGLVILDWHMPGMSGMEILEQIWSIKSQAKILIASGLGPPRELDSIEAAGHKVFLLQKPYLVKDLQNEIAKLLGR